MEDFVIKNIALIFCTFLSLILLVVYLSFRLQSAENKKRKIETMFNSIEEQLHNFQQDTIDVKLNPHLFKNILNSIQSHAYQTYFTIDKLANVLDYMLYNSHKKYVTPKEEIEFALNLIEINRIKLSPLFELKVKIKVNENEPLYSQNVMAPMISVDLIENSFKHADIQNPNSFISITYGFDDSIFSLTVANKISPKEPLKKEKSGIGINLMEQRLRLIYQENFSFDSFVENNVFITHLKINLLEHKAKMLAAG
jgi:LytS/YehU family sensor histidine kinase